MPERNASSVFLREDGVGAVPDLFGAAHIGTLSFYPRGETEFR
jgi:hypothetical protein